MTQFFGGQEPADAAPLDYEATLQVLLSMIGRPVLVLFSGATTTPFLVGIISGRLDRGELDGRLQDVLLRSDETPIETLFFHVGSRQNGFVVRPDEFERGFTRSSGQLTIHLGGCAVTVVTEGELGKAMTRDRSADRA